MKCKRADEEDGMNTSKGHGRLPREERHYGEKRYSFGQGQLKKKKEVVCMEVACLRKYNTLFCGMLFLHRNEKDQCPNEMNSLPKLVRS